MNTLKQSATSPDDTFNKEECHKELRTYHNKLFDLKNMFYADGRFSLLIILQGMDTAGKDGIIRHVLLTEYLEAMPLKFPGSKKGANKPSIIAQ